MAKYDPLWTTARDACEEITRLIRKLNDHGKIAHADLSLIRAHLEAALRGVETDEALNERVLAKAKEKMRRVEEPEPARELPRKGCAEYEAAMAAAPAPDRPGTERVVKSLLLAKQQNKNDGWDQTSGMNFDEAIRRVRAWEKVREYLAGADFGPDVPRLLAILDAPADREGGEK